MRCFVVGTQEVMITRNLFSTLTMEITGFSETLVPIYQTTRYHV
jgi:hypothetical protein